MDSPQRPPRSSIRHQLHLPVSLKLANEELYGQSENISSNGILLSSAFLIPEGSSVVIAVGIVRSRPGTFLSGRGKVVRAESRGTGDFALAIKLDRDFELGQGAKFFQAKDRVIANRRPQLTDNRHPRDVCPATDLVAYCKTPNRVPSQRCKQDRSNCPDAARVDQ
jgi:hypothetical protein